MLQIKRVLFPTDRTAWSKSVFEHALFYARRHQARLYVLTVTWGEPDPALHASPPDASDAFRTSLHKAAQAAGVDLVEDQRTALSADAGILDYAAEIDADLIVMATHGRRGLPHLMIGSVAEAVVRRADCPVFTVNPDAPYSGTGAKRILVPLDFSAHARKALAHARELRSVTGAELHLLHVVQTFPSYGVVDAPEVPRPLTDDERIGAERALREVAAEVLGPESPPTFHVTGGMGNPALDVLDVAEQIAADLIVLATHGRTGVRRFFLGSVAEKVVQLTPCPVFTVKAFGRSLLPGASLASPAVGAQSATA